ncbi:MAG TPA: phosphoribosylaminoimidazolesuccinocarboxamide synthase [Planctomycetia bacterium]|nr:phosphoribosylaminoimidazolesuccinocarboxamide synthase [Planctomycetia bacterium]
MASPVAVLETKVEGVPVRRGKVRDVYDLGDRLVLVASDRISAFDWVLPNGIPDKGRILAGISRFWFSKLATPHHLLSTRLEDMGPAFAARPEVFAGRSALVRKTDVIPFECVVRGYLAGSGWKDYRASGSVCGVALPPGLRQADRLPAPIFTPATKADVGHDENVSESEIVARFGPELTDELRRRSLAIYRQGTEWCAARGVILADTKFEFGSTADGELLLIDEALTPDSSRFWPAAEYAPGRSPPSYDKQFVRDWLEEIGFDKASPPPPLPPAVVERTRAKYVEAFERVTETSFADYLAGRTDF